jgi:hypothetical protein
MTTIDETGYSERPQFFDGQRLFADDLQGLEAFNREMRWLHNRSLHQPGVGRGFAVSGSRGARKVTVQPGYAIDVFGREIVLSRPHVASVPPVAGEEDGTPVTYDLTVGYPSDEDLEKAETREGICLDRGVVRLREKPIFCWVRLMKRDGARFEAKDESLGLDVREGRKIVLARAAVARCQLDRDLSTAERRSARPPRQPYVACGEATVRWDPATFEGGLPYIQAHVSTAGAGFGNTPCYEARVKGGRPKEIELEVGERSISLLVIDLASYVMGAAPDGFQLLVPLFPIGVGDGGSGVEVLRKAVTARSPAVLEAGPFSDWSVEWMGVEG